MIGNPENSPPEPLIEPAVAFDWLVKSERIRIEDGGLITIEAPDPLTYSAWAIFKSGVAGQLSASMKEIMAPKLPTLSKSVLRRVAQSMVEVHYAA